VAEAGVDVDVGRLPVLAVSLAVDPLDVVRALCVAVTGAVFSSSLSTSKSNTVSLM
jgi:hypothetical protein